MEEELPYEVGQAPRLDAAALAASQQAPADIANPRYVSKRQTRFRGHIWDLVSETVSLTEGGPGFERDFLLHPGAVAVLALNDRQEVLLINQYRHPVRANLWEVPAGLLDIEGEHPLRAAARELAEETGLQAGRWDTLMEFYNSPGGMGEACRVYLARDISPLPASDLEEREQEEAEIVQRWLPLEEAVQAVLAGRIHNAAATNAILAADAAARRDFQTLYPAQAPFTAHPGLRDANYRGEIRPAEGL